MRGGAHGLPRVHGGFCPLRRGGSPGELHREVQQCQLRVCEACQGNDPCVHLRQLHEYCLRTGVRTADADDQAAMLHPSVPVPQDLRK